MTLSLETRPAVYPITAYVNTGIDDGENFLVINHGSGPSILLPAAEALRLSEYINRNIPG